jgi:hypothetical protein
MPVIIIIVVMVMNLKTILVAILFLNIVDIVIMPVLYILGHITRNCNTQAAGYSFANFVAMVPAIADGQ